MDDMSRAEYPAMLANLQPGHAAQTLNDRVRRINKTNNEIADWLQERRKVEEAYVTGLRRLAQFRVPNAQSELGTFQVQWDKIVNSVESLAMAHHVFASKIDKDVEGPLRGFHQQKEMQSMQTIQGNLQSMAKELEDAQDKSERLGRKAGKASAQKVDAAAARLDSATQQWESQAPFVFESLQALDEKRLNQLRDTMTQYGTYTGEQAQQLQTEAEGVLNSILDFNTGNEIQQFVAKTTGGRPKIEKRPTAQSRRQSVSVGGSSSNAHSVAPPSIQEPPPPVPPVTLPDNQSDHSVPREAPQENKLRSRIGTMLGRRRQSVHGGFGALSPGKSPFSRASKSANGPGLSPRASASNLADQSAYSRLGALAELPSHDHVSPIPENQTRESNDGTNGTGGDGSRDAPGKTSTSSRMNGSSSAAAADVSDVLPPPGPPPSHQEPQRDSEGFSVPASFSDPISQAEKDAAGEEADQLFKLNIQKDPVVEEDPDAKKAALSSVASSLAMGMPSRRTGTVRGRRDVRNTIYMPATVAEGPASSGPFPNPAAAAQLPRPIGIPNVSSEASMAGSDTQSVRSSNSLGGTTVAKHPDMHEPGLNTSVIETVSAQFADGGEVKSTKVNGEIAFAFNGSEFSSPTHMPIRINNFPALEAIGPNRIFVTNDNPEHPDRFTLDLAHIQKTTIGFSYRLHIDPAPAPAEHVPVLINPAWKPQGDKLGLLLQYKANPAFRFAGPAGAPIHLHNFVLFVTYEGKASGVQTKPSGTHLKDKHIVYWRLGDVTLSPQSDEWNKIVCRVVGEQGAEPLPGVVEARWEFTPSAGTGSASEISVARLEEGKGKEIDDDNPFADDTPAPSSDSSTWVEVPHSRRLVSGKFEAK